MRITAVVVDDEFLARKKVETLLADVSFITIIGEAKNGAQAVELINLKSPDLVFLDINMPDFGGFDVIKKLNLKTVPYIIFTTAYDEHALKAFEVHAVDYLLKPLDEDRFLEAVHLAKERFQQKEAIAINEKMLALLNDSNDQEDPFKRTFEIKEKGRTITIKSDEIVRMEASGNYIELRKLDRKYLFRSTMNSLERQLDPNEFIRIHRSSIVNLRYISSCNYKNNNEFDIRLKNDEVVTSGRNYKQNVIDYMERTGG